MKMLIFAFFDLAGFFSAFYWKAVLLSCIGINVLPIAILPDLTGPRSVGQVQSCYHSVVIWDVPAIMVVLL